MAWRYVRGSSEASPTAAFWMNLCSIEPVPYLAQSFVFVVRNPVCLYGVVLSTINTVPRLNQCIIRSTGLCFPPFPYVQRGQQTSAYMIRNRQISLTRLSPNIGSKAQCTPGIDTEAKGGALPKGLGPRKPKIPNGACSCEWAEGQQSHFAVEQAAGSITRSLHSDSACSHESEPPFCKCALGQHSHFVIEQAMCSSAKGFQPLPRGQHSYTSREKGQYGMVLPLSVC